MAMAPPALSLSGPPTTSTKQTGDLLSELMKTPSLSSEQKIAILTSFPPSVLDAVYAWQVATSGPLRISAPQNVSRSHFEDSEEAYTPLRMGAVPSPQQPSATQPIYPKYVGYFSTSEQARRFRKRARLPPKAQAPDVERVRRYGRKSICNFTACLVPTQSMSDAPLSGQYWVRRIYEAMIDISQVSDSESSIHRQRFMVSAAFEPKDLEATAHHIFDSALAVHERGWSRPSVYYKKVVRGKLIDVSEKSLELRLAKICSCLRQKKATVDDAIRGGVTLALLCDNPEARAFTKASNNMGNKKRGERLRQAKGRQQQEDEQDEHYQSE